MKVQMPIGVLRSLDDHWEWQLMRGVLKEDAHTHTNLLSAHTQTGHLRKMYQKPQLPKFKQYMVHSAILHLSSDYTT